ncbi:binding-protein-dependent transport systems inner membrane component [Segniliparus rotundus DSM 44985]|uniref:Binding-protein-dependent transport systems inner membrane component n=1 Tax=Segniliparus rotundus (strain ATCC BAA-972 / CDC 1076 / CIP 108378 / DSM 44985 / JCM 13578) TaxID=640132 RepID=D6ZDI6_SEGRD|nr:ABC transporter permease [Segniliparus rotundus]ADG97250.1 binding-protein-dependent transport systems inner membrane component [Segniliparus rotundus DSM 44985]
MPSPLVARIVARRGALLVAALALVSLTQRLLPGDGARSALGPHATEAQRAALRHDLWLDRAWPVQFGHWAKGAVAGDFGTTLHGAPVSEVVGSALPNTLLLAGCAFVIVSLLAPVFGGLWALSGASRFSAISTVLIATPEFVVAVALVLVFAMWLDWLPAASVGETDATALILPVVALALPQLAWNTAVAHAAVADQLRAPHVAAAIRDGLTGRRVFTRHVLPSALPAITGSLGTTAGLLFSGALVVESVFNIPGLGQVITGAVTGRDHDLVLGALAPAVALLSLVLCVADFSRNRA